MNQFDFPTLRSFRYYFYGRAGSLWRVSSPWVSESITAKQRSLLRVLSVSHREHLDTGRLVWNLAAEHNGGYRRQLRRLARRLAAPTPLVDALEQTPDALSDSMVLAIRFGSQSGTLQTTFDQLLQTPASDTDNASPTLRQSVFYLIVMSIWLLLIMMFLMFKIVPMFEHVAEEFQWELPRPMLYLVTVFHSLGNSFWFWLLLGIGLAWVVASRRARRFYRRVLASRYLRSVARQRSAELLQLLRPAVATGRPLGSALSTLARYHYDRNVRAKLLFARNEVEQGSDPWNSLAAAGLLTSTESQALVSSTSTQTRAWLMRQLSERQQNRFSRRNRLLLMFIQPLIVLALAAIVLWFGLAFFGFLAGIVGAFA